VENERLKAEGNAFRDDCIAKRRYFASLPKSQLAKLAFLMQSELTTQHTIGQVLTRPPELRSGGLDFDEICRPGSGSITFVNSEFPTVVDPKTVREICETKNLTCHGGLHRGLIGEHKISNQSMADAIRAFRGIVTCALWRQLNAKNVCGFFTKSLPPNL
jgi:hypothetical protein